MKWYGEVGAQLYDYHSPGLESDVEFYLEEARRAGSPVLELGAGTGRTLIPIARAGIDIVGLDLSPSMLAIARRKLAREDASTQNHATLVEGDMRDFTLNQRFPLVTIPYRAFLHITTPEDQRQALLNIREHLVEGGRLVFNVFDPRLDLIVERLTLHRAKLELVSEFDHPETGRHVLVWGTTQYDPEPQLVRQYFIYEEVDEAGKLVSKSYSLLNARYVYRWEMQYLLELCGFEVEALYGDFKRGPFRYGAEQVWVAKKVGSATLARPSG